MEAAGVEAGFIGTSGVVGTYTGLADVGVANMMECIQVGGWIAKAVNFPMILDGDTGHGGIMAVRRMVKEAIRAGLAGVRIDDQSIEKKRGTGTGGIVVEDLDIVLARYRAAVDAKNELDPDFVIMAQGYVGEVADRNFDEAMKRLKAYKEIGGVDWVQFTAPYTVDEVKKFRAAIPGPVSIMQGFLKPKPLTWPELLKLGITLCWDPSPAHAVSQVAVYNFFIEYMKRGNVVYEEFKEKNKDNPFVRGGGFQRGVDGETVDRMRELEAQYFPPGGLKPASRG
jgi:2-methylisocitrate lyase-like PEP mutase family enzyme